LKKGTVPILSLAGARDEPATVMMMGRFAAEVPSARHYELAEGDHTVSLSARAEFDRLVLDFLASVEEGRPWPPPRD
jgi:pimeloyl-ACP methyl ester carboxylesterase